ncbi:MAG: hypothetical protein C4333_13435 [Meiothermus sp.]
MRLRLEAWNPDYALPQVGLDDSSSVDGVVTDLEPPWQPLEPPAREWPVLYFVDGRQRIDAVVANEHGQRALLVTLAAGALVRDDAGIRLAGEPRVERVLLYPDGHEFGPVEIGPFYYRPVALKGIHDLRMLAAKVNEQMRTLEARLAQELQGGLVVLDGPIFVAPGLLPRPGVIGYAKTMWQRYLPPAEERILSLLAPCQRTPVFRIPHNARRPLELFSWYIRLPLNPTAPFHSGAALLRVETPAGDLEHARALADLSVGLLCGMASSPSRDPRAPQNLIPVGGLELWLGRHMGQAEVVRRRILQGLFS